MDAAIAVYEWNMLLAEAFYVPLQCLEVCLRNKIHDRMSEVYGADWLTSAKAAPLNDFSRSMVNKAKEKVGDDASNGKLVAELSFAFWVGLLATQYDATLWRQALHACFKATRGQKRSVVHSRLNAVRRFRNRIAHHEAIYDRPLERLHREMIEAIGWMCTDTCAWAEHHSRVATVLGEKPKVVGGSDAAEV